MSVRRAGTVLVLLLAAVVLQVSLLAPLVPTGVAPDLVLVVVVAVGLCTGAADGAVTGFVGGLLLDAAPPADHVLGQWALALTVVGYLAGTVDRGSRPSWVSDAATVAAGAFVGTSLFALSGLLLDQPGVTVSGVLPVVALATAYDVVLGLAAVPGVRALLVRLEPAPRVGW
ncbi:MULTISPECIES: rod shape-determining protein MreD [Mumia]|uniref:rod shape-determining protein MreD n=1 Tax=Mumia TaxID=1546255 RepID=UPI00141E33B6|nr:MULTISPECIES: rod shape-determining protein MreD [unclassified Mumia]QMW67501.1 rod shape-determining protein MreD [Mumia sp. ZJ1417]